MTKCLSSDRGPQVTRPGVDDVDSISNAIRSRLDNSQPIGPFASAAAKTFSPIVTVRPGRKLSAGDDSVPDSVWRPEF